MEDSVKGKIIIECMDFIESGNPIHKIKANKLLKVMINYYTVVVNNQGRKDLKISLREFILNENGYNLSLRNLHASLN